MRCCIYNTCNMHFQMLGGISGIIYNCSKYDDQVIITELMEEFETEYFECIFAEIQSTLALMR